MMLLLFAGALLSPVWRGGAINHTMEFAKVYVAWALTFLLVTTLKRLRRLILIQAGSVAVVAVISVIKGSSHPRLQGALGGIYSNPNDLAFGIVLTIPFIFLLLLTTKNVVLKALWALTMPIMIYTLFRTASRAGFIDLMISVPVLLWFFAIKGRRPYLIVITVVVGGVLMIVSGKHLRDRISAVSGSDLETNEDTSAYGSFRERKALMKESLLGIVHYPLLGVGVGNFVSYSGKWRQVHMTYLQITVEGGIPVAILYLMFFSSGFRNLKKLRKRRDLDPEATLFVGALFTSLLGFVVGACFAPEAYQFFPYFTVAYVSALLATVREQEAGGAPAKLSSERRFRGVYANDREPRAVPAIR
jgi:O-antigen ligase